MYKIYIPKEKSEGKTAFRGIWQSPEGKLYYDYIKIKEVKSISCFDIEKIRLQYKQEALFIEAQNCAFVFYNPLKIEVLNKKHYSQIFYKKDLKNEIKKYIHNFGGCTIQAFEGGYFVISWSN